MTRTILLVEDEEHLRELVRLCLEDLARWQVITASAGEDCLKILQTIPVEVILLDISMPGMDGITVYEHLQANPNTQAIPVILLTAKVLPSDRAKFAQMGVTGVISKPIQPLTLVAEITEIMGWSAPA